MRGTLTRSGAFVPEFFQKVEVRDAAIQGNSKLAKNESKYHNLRFVVAPQQRKGSASRKFENRKAKKGINPQQSYGCTGGRG